MGIGINQERSPLSDGVPAKDLDRQYQTDKKRLQRLIPRLRKLLDEAGMLEALGPEPAVPQLSI